MAAYVRNVIAQGGVVSIEVNAAGDGSVYPAHLDQLRALKRALR